MYLGNMCWNKKELKEIERLTRILSENVNAYNEGSRRQTLQINLILSHLKLKYVPETETKEPAKLVENTTYLGIDWGTMEGDKGSNCTWTGSGWIITPPPKKRGRPKKK